MIGLSIWFKFEFNYVPPFKNFLALFVVGLVVIVGAVASTFKDFERANKPQTISKLVIVSSLSFVICFSVLLRILHLFT
ncbi:hypothetical protein [Archaeoglobus sp.]